MGEQVPFASGSETSRQAAASMKDQSARDRMRVLECILSRGDSGATCDEVEVLLGMVHQSASARVSELFHKYGRITKSGRVRKTRSGRNATVWIAV